MTQMLGAKSCMPYKTCVCHVILGCKTSIPICIVTRYSEMIQPRKYIFKGDKRIYYNWLFSKCYGVVNNEGSLTPQKGVQIFKSVEFTLISLISSDFPQFHRFHGILPAKA